MHVDPAAPTGRQQRQAVLLAALCALLFLRDALLPGRVLVPFPPEVFDVRCAEAQARGIFDPADAARGNLGMGDKYQQSLCWDRVLQDRLRALELPLWTRDIGGGASFVPQMAQVYQPVNLLLLLLPNEQWYGWWYFVHLVLFGWLCYRFLRRLGCAHPSALVGVVCAVLSLWTQCKLHHNVILTAALSLWPMLSAVHVIARDSAAGRPGERRVGRAVGWLALWTGLSWLSGFAVVSLQVSYLTAAFALLLCLQNERGRRLRPLLLAGGGLALGALLSLAHMVPVLLASGASVRGPTMAAGVLAANGLEWDHALTALWPDLLSWAEDRWYVAAQGHPFADAARMPWSQLVLLAQPLYHGRAIHGWVETSFAIGVPALACALLAAGDARRRGVVVFFAAAALLGFGIATADQPFLSLARLLPGLAAADLRRLLFTVAMALTVLAALGADRVLQERRPWAAVGALGLVALLSFAALLWLGRQEPDGSFVDSVAHAIAADSDHDLVAGREPDEVARWIRSVAHGREAEHNLAMLQTTALRALLAAAAAALALVLPWPRLRVAGVAAVTALELLHAGLGPVQTVPVRRVTTPPAVLAPVLAAPEEAPGVRPRLQRLASPGQPVAASLYLPNLPAYHGIEDAAAYNPLAPARMEEFFRAIEPDRPDKVGVATGGAGVGPFHDPASLRHPLCDLFGIRFVLTDQPVPAGAGIADRTPPQTGPFRLLERTTTLPRATFVRRVRFAPDREERLRLLADPTRPVADEVLLEDPGAAVPAAAAAPPATVRITGHEDQRVTVAVETEAMGYLRLADPYDPGWRVTVDGEPAPLLVADHYLRAVPVPAGRHEVVFTFDAPRVVWPPRLSLLALVAVLALLLRRDSRLP